MVLMLTLCMVTACLVGSTLARFTMGESTRDAAQVAKWGVVLSVRGDLYGTNYLNAAKGNTATAGDTNITVNSNSLSALDPTRLNVVAPGTEGNELVLSLSGTAEVTTVCSLELVAQNIYLNQGIYGEMTEENGVTTENIGALISQGLYINQGSAEKPSYQKLAEAPADLTGIRFYQVKNRFELTDDYYPVVYSAPGLSGVTSSTQSDSLASIAKAFAEAIKGGSVEEASPDASGKISYAVTGSPISAGTELNMGLDPLAVADVETLRITWTWAIEQGETAEEIQMYRSADSLLGRLTADNKTLVTLDNDGNASLLKLDAENGLIENAVGICVGSFKTSLRVSLSVAQLD